MRVKGEERGKGEGGLGVGGWVEKSEFQEGKHFLIRNIESDQNQVNRSTTKQQLLLDRSRCVCICCCVICRLSVIFECLGVVVFYLRTCNLLINVLLNRPNILTIIILTLFSIRACVQKRKFPFNVMFYGQ